MRQYGSLGTYSGPGGSTRRLSRRTRSAEGRRSMRFLCGHPGHTVDVDLTEMVLAELRSTPVEFVTITPRAIGERLRALRRDQQTRRDVLSAVTSKDPVPDRFRVVIVPAEDDVQPYGMYSTEDLRTVRNREQLAQARRRGSDKPTGPPFADVAYVTFPSDQSLQIFPGVEAVPECTKDIVLSLKGPTSSSASTTPNNWRTTFYTS